MSKPDHSPLLNQKNKLVFIVGPTAVGKTAVAVQLAHRINAEIISCDSMQIYKKMDIITSKPPVSSRSKLLHHLIDLVSPNREYDVSRYRRQALKKIKEIIKRDRTPLFVGGTGLYMSILIDGIFKAKAQDKNIRERLYQQAERHGSFYLYNRLKDVDKETAAKIHPHDIRRIVRALEVFKITGKPIFEWQKQRKGLSDRYDIKVFCLNMQRQKLYGRIDARVDAMFKKGLVGEVKRLFKRRLSRTASCAIGIKELKGYFDGQYNLEEARRLMKRNSRQYAKRQLTWFRKDKRIEWIGVSDKEKPKNVAERIWKRLF